MPITQVTPIPSIKPYATPALWNERFLEIDANFSSVVSDIGTAQETASEIEAIAFFMSVAF